MIKSEKLEGHTLRICIRKKERRKERATRIGTVTVPFFPTWKMKKKLKDSEWVLSSRRYRAVPSAPCMYCTATEHIWHDMILHTASPRLPCIYILYHDQPRKWGANSGHGCRIDRKNCLRLWHSTERPSIGDRWFAFFIYFSIRGSSFQMMIHANGTTRARFALVQWIRGVFSPLLNIVSCSQDNVSTFFFILRKVYCNCRKKRGNVFYYIRIICTYETRRDGADTYLFRNFHWYLSSFIQPLRSNGP